MVMDNVFLNGIDIIVTTKYVQNRRHRKKRINKKWANAYILVGGFLWTRIFLLKWKQKQK